MVAVFAHRVNSPSQTNESVLERRNVIFPLGQIKTQTGEGQEAKEQAPARVRFLDALLKSLSAFSA